MRKDYILNRVLRHALLLVAVAILGTPATAAEYFVSDFNAAAETDLGGTSVWQYNNTSNAPWTAGWDSASSLVFNFGAPIAPGENHRLRAPLTTPLPNFTAYPYTKVKFTFSGIPTGQTVLFQIREELGPSGSSYIKRTWPVGNGTQTLTFDGTDIPNFDGGSAASFNAATDTYFRIRLQIDLTTVPTWQTDYANIHASIDYVAITDDPNYGEASEGEGEGEGEGPSGDVVNYTAGVGKDITFTVPSVGNATTNGFTWSYTPKTGGSTVPLSETSKSLTLHNLIYDDAGSYRAEFDDGAKAARSYTAVLNVVAQVPVSNWFAVLSVALVLSAVGVSALRVRSAH